MPEFQFDYSSWFVFICLIIGAAYAFITYSRRNPWSISTNRILAVIRFVVVSLLLILLLNPLLRQLIDKIEHPIVVMAVDDSSSIKNSSDSLARNDVLQKLQGLIEDVSSDDLAVEVRTLEMNSTSVSDINFDKKETDLNALFRQIEVLYDGKNLESVLLVSDGNYNRGVSPAYFPYSFKINTLGVGDTTIKEDLLLKNVLFNKIAYQGNQFPIIAEITNKGFVNQKAKVKVSQRGKTISSQDITFDEFNGLSIVEFKIDAEKNGIQHYRVSVESDSEEVLENNSKDVFIDIIDGKQKILMMAPSPHPDIKAFRSVIEKNENYEFSVFIPGTDELENEKYDLIIAHQAGDRYNRLSKYIDEFLDKDLSIFYVLGQSTDVNRFSKSEENFEFTSIRNQRDQVGAAINVDFSKFTINPDFNEIFTQFPTLNVHYGNHSLSPDDAVLLYQKIGSITTDRPLLYVSDRDDKKKGFLMADGIWQWRLQEYAFNENTESFDDVFLKLIQYLSTKEDKRKFRVFTTKDEFYDNEAVSFETEIYNDNYERVYGDQVIIEVRDELGNSTEYSLVTSSSSTNLEISGMKEGIYSYKATLERDGRKEVVNGRFTVNKLQLEQLDQTANFELLRQVSENTGGKFYDVAQFDQLLDDLRQADSKGVLHTTEDFFAMINLKWLFFLALILLSTEWFTRKYSGGY